MLVSAAVNLGKLSPRLSRNFVSSRSVLKSPIEAHKYVQFLTQRSENPVWHLVKSLARPVEVSHIYDYLYDNKISVEKFKKWEPILSQPDISHAVEALKAQGLRTTPIRAEVQEEKAVDSPSTPYMPSFVLFSLVVNKVNTPAQAAGPLMDLVFSHLNSESHYNRGPLLILATYQLARFNLANSFQPVLDAFLNAQMYAPVIQFNGLLQALSSMSFRAARTSKNIMTLFKAMDERNLKITPATCKSLLKGESCDVNVAQYLFHYMTTRKVQHRSTPALLEQFVHAFTNHGRRDLAIKFFKAFERTAQSSSDPTTTIALSRARLSILSSFTSRKEAKEFLETLSGVEFGEWTKVYNETAVFNVSANDRGVGAKLLIDIFLRLPARPSVVTYTILLRGLIHRHDFRSAVIHWNKLTKQSSLVVDRNALAAGVEALIRDQKPHEAFQVMEKYCRRPGFDYDDPSYDGPPPVELSTIAMNQILVAMNRIKRPDAVFRLWEHMDTLYGCHPNAMTLSILLQAAKIARTLDDSLSAVLAKVKLLNPFKTKTRPNQPIDRRLEAVNEIISCIGHPSRGSLRRYTSGIWRGQEPVDFVTKIFLQVLFGNDHHHRLLGVESPATAMLKSYDSAPPSPFSSPKKYVFVPFPDLLTTPEGQSHFPQIVATNVHCLMYITMIGVAGRAGEIPLVLAWMKELGIVPSTPLLAAALVFWSEISTQAPLMEMWSGGPEKNEYTKLVVWMREWVGERRMPSDALLLRWRRVIHEMRTVGNRAEYEKIKDIWT